MTERPPEELLARCRAISDEANQGEPLRSTDYVWFFVVTLLLPVIIIVLGVLL